MSKYLIIQSFVGTGSWWGSTNPEHKDKSWGGEPEKLDDLYNNLLIPSVNKYCKKHGYRHVVYREQYDLIEMLNQKRGTHFGNLYHEKLSALKHRNDDVDYIVFLDSDFYLTKHAKPLPETNYIKGVVWSKEAVGWWAKGEDPETFSACEGGIQILTKEAALDLANYIKKRMMDYILYNERFDNTGDERTVGQWMTNHKKIKPENLDRHYNYLLENIENREWTEKDKYAGFWHFAGKNKVEKLKYVLERIDGL